MTCSNTLVCVATLPPGTNGARRVVVGWLRDGMLAKSEKPRHAVHEAGPIITSDLCPVHTRLMYEALPRSQSFRLSVDAVWSDQFALPNRAFALRLWLEWF